MSAAEEAEGSVDGKGPGEWVRRLISHMHN